MAFLTKIFGDANARELKRMAEVIERSNALEPEISALSDIDLRGKREVFRARLKEGEPLDSFLPEAFAAVREAARRTLKQRHFDVQLLGGMALHEGKIAEMRTGEGKTLAATAPAYLNALSGKGVHVVTVNDYLARRDAVWMGQIYDALGLSVSCITHDAAYLYDPAYQQQNSNDQITNSKQIPNSKIQNGERDSERDTTGAFRIIESYLRPVTRKEAYAADITYGTNNEFAFDYLRDNMAVSLQDLTQRGYHFAIVDEVDSILIDEARTPLIISAPDTESTKLYDEFARIVPRLHENEDYNVDEKLRAVTLTDEGVAHVERILGMPDLFTDRGIRFVHHLEQALRANVLFTRDKDYVVRNGEVIIVDEFTGRMMPGRRYSEGLHQALEAKEGVLVQQESRTLATITFQNYFRMYEKLSGMTGTAATNAEEFHKVYKLEVVVTPTHRLMIRHDMPDLIFKSEQGKFSAVAAEVKKRHEAGQPVLIGTISIEKNEHLSALLAREGIPHNVLNAKHHEQEAEIIAQAGKRGAVTVATNMAGRGVDIILGGNPPNPEEAEKVCVLGGLHIIGTERHEARRIDNQLRGRAGRQGDPGSTQFFVSLEDDLMRIFGGDRIKGFMEKMGIPEDQPIENKFISNALETAQGKIEGHHFDTRKHVLEYDDVMSKHREVIYRRRREILEELKSGVEELEGMLAEELDALVLAHTASDYAEDWNVEEIWESCAAIHALPEDIHRALAAIKEDGETYTQQKRDLVKETMATAFAKLMQERKGTFGEEGFREVARFVLLRTIDAIWMDHLEAMEALRDSVRLRAYGQRDPLVEYKNEGHRMFLELLQLIRSQAVRMFFRVQAQPQPASRPADRQIGRLADRQTGGLVQNKVNQSVNLSVNKSAGKVSRNDPCPCGSGKKYKRCHGA